MRPAAALAVLAGWAVLGGVTAALHPWIVDDAFVTFRYADHVLAGDGPVWNVGERVEGYTSPLWLLVCCGLGAFGLDPVAATRALGVALAASVPVALVRARTPGADVAALLAGTCVSAAAWAAGGLETPLVLALSAASWVRFAEDRDDAGHGAVLGLLGGLLVLTRPDAALVPLVQVAALAVGGRRRSAAVAAGVAGAVVLPHEAWRWAYYGWPLPNTFYAKVGARSEQLARGVEYATRALPSASPFLLPLTLAVVRPVPVGLRAPLAYAALHGAYVLAVGGDGLPAWRFWVPLAPPLALVAGGLLADRARVAPALAALGLAAAPFDRELTRIRADGVSANGEEVGRFLRARVPPDTLIATNSAGALPYYSGLPTVDMLGLCDAHVAHGAVAPGMRKAGHEKADGAYVLGRRPALVLFGGPRGRADPFFGSDEDLFRQPGFRADYVLERVALPSGRPLVAWRRRDFPALGTARP